jgi:Ulp1 family protease
VIFPVLILNSCANNGHYVATLVDFARKEVTVYDTSGHDGNYIIVHALMKKWLLDLYGSQGKELSEWIYFGVNQVDRRGRNNNCGVSVIITCSYILLGLEVNFHAENLNVWRKKIALKILKHLYTAAESSSVIIDLSNIIDLTN